MFRKLWGTFLVVGLLGATLPAAADNNFRDAGLVEVGAEYAWSQGFTGKGAVVAIIDTGVNPSSQYTAGQIIDGYCVVAPWVNEVCADGTKELTGLAAANRVRESDEHGLGMAGLVAGNPSSEAPGGIAPDAKVIMLQAHGGDVEVIKALRQVLKFREKYNVVAVSMSFGRPANDGASRKDIFRPCDEMPSLQEMKVVFRELRAKGVMPFAAAGNVASKANDLNQSPACLSEVVDVGATNRTNEISTYVTAAEKIELLAPDYVVTETNTGFRSMSGTSVATPLVAGAYALMRQAYPKLNPEETLLLLKASGKRIADPYISDKPLIDLKSAIALAGGPEAGDPTGETRPFVCEPQLKTLEMKWLNSVKYIKVTISGGCDNKVAVLVNGTVIKSQKISTGGTVTAKVTAQEVHKIEVTADGFTLHENSFLNLWVEWKRLDSNSIKVTAAATSFGEVRLGSKVIWRGVLNPKGAKVRLPLQIGKTASIFVNGVLRSSFGM